MSIGRNEAGTTAMGMVVDLATASAGDMRAEMPTTRATIITILDRPSAGVAITEAMATPITAIESRPALSRVNMNRRTGHTARFFCIQARADVRRRPETPHEGTLVQDLRQHAVPSVDEFRRRQLGCHRFHQGDKDLTDD